MNIDTKTRTGSTTKTLTGAADEGAADRKRRAQRAQEAREEADRKASAVKAQIRRLEDHMEHTERDIGRTERRLEELTKGEETDRKRDRRTRERIGDYVTTIGMARNKAKKQREEAERVTSEAAGQGLALTRARTMGRTDNGRVKEQVEEKLRQADRLEREAATIDRVAKDLGIGMQELQDRLDRREQVRRENQGQAAEHIERVRQEVAARRQEASKLKVMREELRKREEEVGRERDLLNTGKEIEEPWKPRGRRRGGGGGHL